MRAAVFNGVRDITIEELPKPQINADEFLLKVKSSAICGSDLRTYLHGHHKINKPTVLGHEFSGEVIEVGENIEGVEVGDRVGVHPGLPCGSCYYCDQGKQNLCEDRKNFGIHMQGAFAEYMVIPNKTLEVGTVVKIPEDVPYEIATLGDPAVAALNGQENTKTQLGDEMLILGAGPIGLLHAMIGRVKGAINIMMADVNEKRLEMAKEIGVADHYHLITTTEELKTFSTDASDSKKGPNKVVVANTATQSAVQAVEVCAKGGLVMLFAGFPKNAPELGINGNTVHYNDITVTTSYGSTPRQFHLAQKMLFNKTIDGESLITHTVPLEEINAGFELVESGEAIKCLISYE